MNALLRNRKGQGLTEYVLVLVVVVGLVIYLISRFKSPMQSNIDTLATDIKTPGQQ